MPVACRRPCPAGVTCSRAASTPWQGRIARAPGETRVGTAALHGQEERNMSISTLPARAGCRLRRALATALLVGLSAPAHAATLSFVIDEFSGDPAEALVTLDDGAADGSIALTVTALSVLADIRGIFFDVADDSVVAGLQILGGAVTEVAFGDVIDLRHGANVKGSHSPCPCDVGVEIGTQGIGSDDYQSVSLTLVHESLDLDLSLFSSQVFAVRLTSVGDDCRRDGSSKLGGTAPVVPEPSTAALTGLGLLLLAAARRARFALA
jgi:hypothetical protein